MNMIYIPVAILVILLTWISLMTLILKNEKVSAERIKVIGDFFIKVIPKVPITGIAKMFKKGKSDE